MPITPHIEAVAKRTIEEIQDYYKNYSDDINDTNEMEHRIARVELLKEACNGLAEKDKLQKTAENLFEVGTAWERGQDMIKKIIRKNQKDVENRLSQIRRENNNNYEKIQASIKELSKNMNNKFEEEKQYNESHYESKMHLIVKDNNIKTDSKETGGFKGMILRFFDSHFVGCLFGIIFIIIILFISGHTDLLQQIIGKM